MGEHMNNTSPRVQKGSQVSFPLEVQQLIAGLEDGVVLTEGEWLAGANPALGRMLGLPAEGLVGRRTAEFFCDSEGRPLRELARSDAIRLRDRRGGLVPALVRELGSGVFLVADRSRESRLEAEVWRLSQRLCRLDQASRVPESLQGEAAGMIEHEIRTATTAIRGYLRMLVKDQAGEINPTQRTYLRESLCATERIQALLDDLLEMATPDAPGVLRVLRKPERLGPILDAAVAATRPLLEQRRVRLKVELDVEPDEILADARRLGQVIVNLLSNATKFTPKGTEVRVATSLVELERGGFLCFSVEDRGPGVQAEEVERIFEPFVRGRLANGGVGLGLAICRKIVEAHGGKIEAVPSLGHGLFRVLLPLDR
jgi:signal transduction histidine kinase